jgi:tRNA pseudouridine55 synthase
MSNCGILPVNKAAGCSSFHLVSLLRKRTQMRTIGHAGTLDPFATGVMVLLLDRSFTRLAGRFLDADKQYRGIVELGKSTDTYDREGTIVAQSEIVPSYAELERALQQFQGEVLQVPPLFSAKKVGGKRCYELARRGITVELAPVRVRLSVILVRYEYPHVELEISCSKGTYIRSLAHDLGKALGCGGMLSVLTRVRVGPFHLRDCVDQVHLLDSTHALTPYLRTSL